MSYNKTLDQLVFVGCYSTFENLAHVPKGTPASYSIHTYRLNQETGMLTLLSVSNEMQNPAFMRFHPQQNILYVCSESIKEDDKVIAFSISPTTGLIRKLCEHSTAGKSCCYLTLDKQQRHLLYVNYWDSSIGTFPVEGCGMFSPVKHVLRPQKRVKADNRGEHLSNRQSEPHAHAIVLDPYLGSVAYIPDLGEDVIKQYIYDIESGQLTPAGAIKADSMGITPSGPRYIEFHPTLPVAFLVNELSSTVSVFEFEQSEASLLVNQCTPDLSNFRETLIQIQSISTIPFAYPRHLNTCGRITVDPTGTFVLVSNRGHNSIAIFRISDQTRTLTEVGYFHTHGKTPRHFQFDKTGKFLIVANQDTDSIAVFHFDQKTGSLTFSGNRYEVHSPNFVCVCAPHAYQQHKL
eukprot:TRINITY_DN5053_c0_g1_i1.p1 TRINITY_DN5053_c0_g1~~TRINITY_DN5053_c0_g1_i1.p1  ORF type:complete len:406 (-),score=59.49 TRINITY_DN5053_c0_g1_i1:63-1280(-)